MSALVYFIADYYPWWGIPIALIFAEIANTHRRRGDRKKMLKYLSISFLFFAAAAAYVVFDGFSNLRPEMERAERVIRTK